MWHDEEIAPIGVRQIEKFVLNEFHLVNFRAEHSVQALPSICVLAVNTLPAKREYHYKSTDIPSESVVQYSMNVFLALFMLDTFSFLVLVIFLFSERLFFFYFF